MALKPTIYKFTISLSDLDRDYYDTLNLTVAKHPSETVERMVTRVLAFCHNASEGLSFTKGLSTPDEPDIWQRSLDDRLMLWIDMGEPAFDRIKKATRLAKTVKVYSFNNKSDVWWRQEQSKFSVLTASIYQFPWPSIHALGLLVERTMETSITISGTTAYVSAALGEVEIPMTPLQSEQ